MTLRLLLGSAFTFHSFNVNVPMRSAELALAPNLASQELYHSTLPPSRTLAGPCVGSDTVSDASRRSPLVLGCYPR